VNDSAAIAAWIVDLADSDSYKRTRAGLKIYLAGVNRFMPLLNVWLSDLTFREMTLPYSRLVEEQKKNGPSAIVVGVAVSPEVFDGIRKANGAPRLAEVPADQDAKEFELEIDESAKLDILTTREPGGKGAIAKYLERFGDGIQQVELYVRDVERATEILKSNFNLAAIYPQTRGGADGTRVNFLLATTPSGEKLLVELVEAEK
jgi:hypothetical protein